MSKDFAEEDVQVIMSDKLPQRKNLRLVEYDYSQNGCYFVTLCTHNRQKILSDIRRGGALLHPFGRIVKDEISKLMQRYDIKINPYVIMPDHVHMIITLGYNKIRAEQSPAPTSEKQIDVSIGDIVCTFKSLTTKRMNKYANTPGRKLWQRNYFEHIIRNENDYCETYQYIIGNPSKYKNKNSI